MARVLERIVLNGNGGHLPTFGVFSVLLAAIELVLEKRCRFDCVKAECA